MAQASRDNNYVPALLGVSSSDSTTPLNTTVDPSTGRLRISATLSSPLTVAQGGTGNTTFTPYAVITAGTTATGAFQNVSGLGSVGEVLTSNGAGQLPTWQAVGAGSGANTALSNLASVAINTTLVSDTDNTDDLGSAAVSWKDAYVRTVKFDGSTSGTTTLIPTAIAGTTTLTLPAVTAEVTALGNAVEGSGSIVLATSPNLTTPNIGVATATSVNKVAFTAPASAATLTIADGKTLTANNSITLAGTDSTVMTFPSTSATIARTDAANTFTGASTASAWVLTAPTITTSIVPTSNDGAALGSTSNMFSDAFLASGAVVNFNNGDVTLTHSSNLLTLAGGQFTFGANTAYFVETDNGNSGTADTIDWTLSNKQKSTLTGNVTYTFTAPGGPASLILKVLTGAGSFTATWPAAVKWAGGTAPTITTTASRMDLICFYYDGTNYWGTYSQNYTP